MHDIITNGTEIKQRIISEINNAKQCINLAMAWFTDRDIANALINAKNMNVDVEVILSSNVQNETVKQMLRTAGINVHAFDTGDDRGVMHHKFCLLDHRTSINGSYNYSYNASNNNVENIHVSDDLDIYRQLLSEFERLRYNVDHKIAVNTANSTITATVAEETVNPVEAFTNVLSNLVYSSTDFNSEAYKTKGYQKSKDSFGSIEIFRAEYVNITEEVRILATDDSLASKKSVLTAGVNAALESFKEDFETGKRTEIAALQNSQDVAKRHLNDKKSVLVSQKSELESGNEATGEKGLLQINMEIDKLKLERRVLEESFLVRKFTNVSTLLVTMFFLICVFYLSIFFASALYKVFFEENVIRMSVEQGITPALPQIVDANAIVKIFRGQGALFGIISALVFLFPLALTNLKILGSKNKITNAIFFLIGLVVFDVIVSGMVALNVDKIESLLRGQEPSLKFWQVATKGEFYLIFIFGTLPLFITHFLVDFLVNAYRKSRKDLIDAEKLQKVHLLEDALLELNTNKSILETRIEEKKKAIAENEDRMREMETDLINEQNRIEEMYAALNRTVKSIHDDFISRINSGKIFTDEILNGLLSSFKAGFIGYLPEYYADAEVASRVRELEQITSTKRL